MAINFPASPSTNDTFTAGSITYKWDGDKWIGLGVTPADRIVEGSNSLEINASNHLIWSGNNVGLNIDPTSTVSTNAPLSIKNSTESSATRFNLVNAGSTTVESTQIYSQNDDLVLTTTGSDRLRITSDGNTGIGRSPSYSGVFGGSQRTLHIGGSAAPCLRITSDTASQGD